MTTRSRIITTIFRPDVWFVMPPACNVVFPEECTSVSYNRQMMQETTRLELQTASLLLEDSASNVVSEQLIQQYYFAPALGAATGKPTLPDRLGKPADPDSTSAASLTAMMYDHEKFTGIIPKIERIYDTAFYAAIEAGTGATRTDATTVEQYAQRVALFNFLRNRYTARRASVACTFLPRLVAGFPALVVNRPKETDTDDPTHFVGMITNVSHTLNQDGGMTSFSLSYARPHTIASEEDAFLQFLAALDASTPTVVKTVTYDVSPEDTADIKRVNEQLRAITTVILLRNGDPLAELWVPISQGNWQAATKEDPNFVRPAFAPSVFSAGVYVLRGRTTITDTLSIEDLFADEPITAPLNSAFRKYFQIKEAETAYEYATRNNLSVYDDMPGLASADGLTYPFVLSFTYAEAATTKKASFEEIVTPPWFSDLYKNENISGFYKRLLGCPSMGEQFGDSASVEAAAVKVVDQYSEQANVKAAEGDPKFIYRNTKREIPTQAEVFEFHHFASTGNAHPLYGLDKAGTGVVESNTEFIARNRLDTTRSLDLSGEGRLDPRQERYLAVKLYHDQLLGRRAFRG